MTTPHRSRVGSTVPAICALATIALALGGCGTSSPSPAAASTTTTPAPTNAPSPSPAASGPSTATGSSSSPAAAGGAAPYALRPNQIEQLVTILETVNPAMSTDDATLVNGSLQICQQIKGGLSGPPLASATATQFANGGYTPSPEEVDAIDSAITKTFCF